jgi:hypothetical protein
MKNEKYNLFFIDHKIDGLLVFGSGGIDSTINEIVICKKKHPTDYDIMTEWVKGL